MYQSFLAGVTILLALAFLVAGLLLGRKLSRVSLNEDAKNNAKSNYRVRCDPQSITALSVQCATTHAFVAQLVVVAGVVAVSVALHAVFIFILAITNPGIPYLALILLALDTIASVFLLWSLPNAKQVYVVRHCVFSLCYYVWKRCCSHAHTGQVQRARAGSAIRVVAPRSATCESHYSPRRQVIMHLCSADRPLAWHFC